MNIRVKFKSCDEILLLLDENQFLFFHLNKSLGRSIIGKGFRIIYYFNLFLSVINDNGIMFIVKLDCIFCRIILPCFRFTVFILIFILQF